MNDKPVTLLSLVESFVTSFEEAQTSDCYNAVCDLISLVMGTDSLDIFTARVDATDGGFYLKEGDDPKTLFTKMMKKQQHNEQAIHLADQQGWAEENDNYGQILFYTGLKRNKKGKLVPFKG